MIIYLCSNCGKATEAMHCPQYLPDPPEGWVAIEVTEPQEDRGKYHLCPGCKPAMNNWTASKQKKKTDGGN